MILREDLRHIIVIDKLSLVKLCEHSFSECLLDCLEVYHPEPCEDAVLPVSVSEESFDRAHAEVRASGDGSLTLPQQFVG